MTQIRSLIVDDEPLARDAIRLLLQNDPEIEVVGECADGEHAARAILELAPDLLFLDVQMPELDGFDVLERVPAEAWPVTVFVTAYDRYALRAFEVHALDYLLKPFDDERFDHALRRAKAQVRTVQIGAMSQRLSSLLESLPAGRRAASGLDAPAARPGVAPTTPTTPIAAATRDDGATPQRVGDRPKPLRRLAIQTNGRVVFLSADEIDWIEAADYYVRLHVGDRTHLLRESMRGLEKRLDPDRFFRIHRSAIVNLDRIRELQPWFHGQYLVILTDGTQLKLSRRRRARLEALLGHRIGPTNPIA